MAGPAMNHQADAGFFSMRQALVEARLMSEKRAFDAVYVATVAEELRDIEKKIAALEEPCRSGADGDTVQVLSQPTPEESPDAEWIHRKARELCHRLHIVEQASKREGASGTTGSTKVTTAMRAVPRYRQTQRGMGNRNTYKGESKI